MATTGGGPEPTWNAVRTPAASSSAASPASVSPIPSWASATSTPARKASGGATGSAIATARPAISIMRRRRPEVMSTTAASSMNIEARRGSSSWTRSLSRMSSSRPPVARPARSSARAAIARRSVRIELVGRQLGAALGEGGGLGHPARDVGRSRCGEQQPGALVIVGLEVGGAGVGAGGLLRGAAMLRVRCRCGEAERGGRVRCPRCPRRDATARGVGPVRQDGGDLAVGPAPVGRGGAAHRRGALQRVAEDDAGPVERDHSRILGGVQRLQLDLDASQGGVDDIGGRIASAGRDEHRPALGLRERVETGGGTRGRARARAAAGPPAGSRRSAGRRRAAAAPRSARAGCRGWRRPATRPR